MESTLTYLQRLTDETHKPEAEVLTLAFQAGIRQLWREHVLGRYLRHEVSREEAIEAVGFDLVELAERQHQAVMEDIEWALHA
ncbi:hypothetical protein U27_07085 [Candidatus Vecturithrix granuli]|uniref:Uncharacterized protein n=1 Tax=Vecturithrix granuli TaxID=1499967 RepID=A0A081C692_VECG1|nr:hypothetical protein U27_07085 [Candidatus Vecturithrix granuli]